MSSHPDRIITPHPGEAGRLLGRSAGEVESDRLAALDDLVDIVGGVVVLKGGCTLVGRAGRTPRVSTRGNPGMATAGSGDILTGVIAALRAQGLSMVDAALLGVDAHARAGDLAAGDGGRGLIATDLLPGIRRALNP
jgi:NAD(P)H-hydrate epimerase